MAKQAQWLPSEPQWGGNSTAVTAPCEKECSGYASGGSAIGDRSKLAMRSHGHRVGVCVRRAGAAHPSSLIAALVGSELNSGSQTSMRNPNMVGQIRITLATCVFFLFTGSCTRGLAFRSALATMSAVSGVQVCPEGTSLITSVTFAHPEDGGEGMEDIDDWRITGPVPIDGLGRWTSRPHLP